MVKKIIMKKQRKMMENKEFTVNCEIQLRQLDTDDQDSRIVCGYAVKFDSESQDMGFIEVIRKGAITEETIMKSDIYARFNHDEDTVLARSRYGEGSLALELREDGLYYEFEAPHTAIGDELLEHLKRGEMTTSSFAFTLPKDGSGERWTKKEDGTLFREITKIDRLFDVSPVYEPAYLATSVSKRALEMVEENDRLTKLYEDMMEEIKKYMIE
jgi:HK97 family phage prohead protease